MTRLPRIAIALLVLFASPPANARIVGVRPIDGAPALIIAAPAAALDSEVADGGHMLGFDERQDMTLEADLVTDSGTIVKGTRIDSHLILFNLPDGSAGAFSENEWIFSGPVLGVMSDTDGLREAASSRLLGAPGTAYPESGYPFRGLENDDGYDGIGNTRLRVRMFVWQPGDWIRVITGPQPVAGRETPRQTAAEPAAR